VNIEALTDEDIDRLLGDAALSDEDPDPDPDPQSTVPLAWINRKAAMSGDKRARLKEWLQSGTVLLQPLTLPQRELWEAAPVPVGDVSNHICCLIKVRGAITAKDLRIGDSPRDAAPGSFATLIPAGQGRSLADDSRHKGDQLSRTRDQRRGRNSRGY
jgi:hypothetical protein